MRLGDQSIHFVFIEVERSHIDLEISFVNLCAPSRCIGCVRCLNARPTDVLNGETLRRRAPLAMQNGRPLIHRMTSNPRKAGIMARRAAAIVALLIISPCLFDGRIDASKYEGIPDGALPTSSGYLTVNKTSGASLFYVYYEAQTPNGSLAEIPIVLWLQGGPGCSGLIGSFFEMGPWLIGADQQFHPNDAAWNRLYGLLFFDQPVGTGFSTAPSPADVPKDEEETSRDIFTALEVFYSQNDFRSRPLYATGESYAGKYVPGLGYYYLQQIAKGAQAPAFELKGLGIGNGLTDPITQIPVYAPAAFYMGLIDWDQKQALDTIADSVVDNVEKGRYDLAHDDRSALSRALYNLTGLASLLDIRRTADYYTYPNGSTWLSPVINSPALRKALGVRGNGTWEDCTDYVDINFRNLTMKSNKFMVEAILPHLPVLLYQGQFDLQDGVASNEVWMRAINWTETAAFWSTNRRVWTLDGETAAYIRTHDNLAHVVVLGAGHLVPSDQGVRSLQMLEAWIGGFLSDLGSDSHSTVLSTEVSTRRSSCPKV